MFHPSSTLPPVQFDADPQSYHQAQKAKRGDPAYVMSRGETQEFAACPRKWIRGTPRKVTKAMKWGDVVDVITLTPHLVETVFVITPDTYETTGMKCPSCGSVTDSKKCKACKTDRVESAVVKDWSANSDTCRGWVEAQEAEGKRVITGDMISEAWKANARLLEDEEIASILAASKRQVVVNVEWHSKATGLVIPFKSLLDIVPDPKSKHGDTLYDLKCTADASQRKWQRTVYTEGHFYQSGAYLMAMNAASGLKYRQFAHVISETDSPYEPVARTLTVEFLQLGINDFTRDMEWYCHCLKTGKFPGYDNSPVDMENWMLTA